MSFIPRPHEIYKHFKGNLYQITAIAEHTETGEALVVYQAMYGDFKTYARPLDMFISPVDRDKYPDAAQEFRFELQGPDAARQKAEMGLCSRKDSAEPGEASLAGGRDSMTKSTSSLTDARDNKADGAAFPAGRGTEAAGTEQTPHGQGTLSGVPGQEEESEELNIDPQVLEFLDADTYEQRLNILTGLRHRITDDMITTMAIACDLEVGAGDVEERYESLKTCLLTMERYECNRLR